MFPSFFIAHGAPSLAIQHNEYTESLTRLAGQLPKPRAIVLFSAHWESTVQRVSGTPKYDTIYDFSGFEEELYEIRYDADGDSGIANEVRELLSGEGIPAQINEVRGLDHGAWVVLHLMYPEADIPVITLSVNRHLPNAEQYRIGKALASLREKQMMIIGSGGTVHNLRRLDWGAEEVNDWAVEFDRWLEDKLKAWDTEALVNYNTLAPFAKEAVPTPEHFIPLLLAMGAGDGQRKAELLHRSYQFGNLSHSIWKFE